MRWCPLLIEILQLYLEWNVVQALDDLRADYLSSVTAWYCSICSLYTPRLPCGRPSTFLPHEIFVFCSWFFISLVSCLTDAYSSCRCLPDSGVTSSQRPALTAIANLLPVTILSLMIAPSSFPFLHLHNLFVQLFLRTPQGASPSRIARHLEANTVNTS